LLANATSRKVVNMEASAESAISHLGFAACVEAAVLDQRGWMVHFESESMPVDVTVRKVPGVRNAVAVKLRAQRTLDIASEYAVLEHNDVPMVMFNSRTPSGARWGRVLTLNIPDL
jgi:hypothetical protein